MASKSLVLLALTLVWLVPAEMKDNCPCDTKDVKANAMLWKFLEKLSADVPDEDKNMYAVLPGELSPLVDCECAVNRRKRHLIPAVNRFEKKVRAKKSLRYRGACPSGRILFNGLCVLKDFFDYLDYE